MEMLAGAPLLMDELTGDLKALIDEKSALIAGWVKRGKLAPIDPQHLIFYDLGFHSTLRRFCPSGGGGDRRDVAR